VAVLQHDVDERSGVKAIGEAAKGRYLPQEIGSEGSGNLLRLFEEEVTIADGEAGDFVEGHLKGDSGLAGVGGRLDAGDAHAGGGAYGRRGPFGLLPRTRHKIAWHEDSLALDNSHVREQTAIRAFDQLSRPKAAVKFPKMRL
jgi:hypothetical protein